jgi:transposase
LPGLWGRVKRERLAFLADNPLYTKRFAYFVDRRCRQATIKDVAKELKLDWHTVKDLDKQYMTAQWASRDPRSSASTKSRFAKARSTGSWIVVSDLVRRRPIWFGGTDRSEASMGRFYNWQGPRKNRGIRLAVMDMWKPFRNVAAAVHPAIASCESVLGGQASVEDLADREQAAQQKPIY